MVHERPREIVISVQPNGLDGWIVSAKPTGIDVGACESLSAQAVNPADIVLVAGALAFGIFAAISQEANHG